MQAETLEVEPQVQGRVWDAREFGALTARHVAILATVLGGLLRLYHYNSLSLWVDEGMTVGFSRLPWGTVLGLHGAYDVHPPLYYVLVKLVSLLFPETEAGRLISVAAGTLTIPVLYLLASRLAGRRAGATAALVLAVAPAHIWYSQEARQYALTTLLVAISYLALVAYVTGGQRRWLPAYGASLILAMYTEYSAIFALAPQLMILAVAVRHHARRCLSLAGAGVVAALLFVPWLPQLMAAAGPTSEQTQFALTPEKVTGSVLALVGLAGNGLYYWGGPSNPWDRWVVARPVLAVLLLLSAGIGGYVLARRSPLGLPVAAGLLVGTVVTVSLISLVYPSLAVRTVLYGVLGWSILLAACLQATGRNRVFRIAGLASGGILAALSLLTVISLYRGADKQHWNVLAMDTASATRSGFPVVRYPTVAGTLLGLYAPHGVDAKSITVPDGGALPTLGTPPPRGVWLAYIQSPGIERLTGALQSRGYRQVMHQYYWNPLYLDLYFRPGPMPGRSLPINGTFAAVGTSLLDWRVAGTGGTVSPDRTGGNILTLENNTTGQSEAQVLTPATPGTPYFLALQARSRLRSGRVAVFLICTTQSGQMLSVAPDGAGASIPNDRRWHGIQIAALCPAGTTSLLTDIRSTGEGASDFRRVDLRDLTTGSARP